MTEPSKTPAEQAVELAFFAPIGFALEARSLLPTFVERGRQQVAMAKMIGQFAVVQGGSMGRTQISKARAQAESVLAELGLVPVGGSDPGGSSPLGGPSASEGAAAAQPAPVAQASEASGDLAISDYDSLAASQVIPRLPGLDEDQLEAVRTYEAAHRARKTILGRIAQLQGS